MNNQPDSIHPRYRRILLKLSGEALRGPDTGIDITRLTAIAGEIKTVVALGVQCAVVIGGGNLVRGIDLQRDGFHHITADNMGMLATVINGLALYDALQQASLAVSIYSAIAIPGMVEQYFRHLAIEKLNQGNVVIFVAGTGVPLVTTDSAAAWRGIEVDADILLKATKVAGVFAQDPLRYPQAAYYHRLSFTEVIAQRLGIMDLTAMLLCQAHRLPIQVFNMSEPSVLVKIILGEEIGTLITEGSDYATDRG